MTHVFKDCEQGFHGEYCDKECGKCRDGAVCDSLNGVCPNGCEDNWILPNCTGDIWYSFNANIISDIYKHKCNIQCLLLGLEDIVCINVSDFCLPLLLFLLK